VGDLLKGSILGMKPTLRDCELVFTYLDIACDDEVQMRLIEARRKSNEVRFVERRWIENSEELAELTLATQSQTPIKYTVTS